MAALLYNREGRRVVVAPELYDWYINVQGYTPMGYIERGQGQDQQKVAVLREVGGLGDVICVQSVVAALQEQGLEVTLYTPKKFWPVCIANLWVTNPADGDGIMVTITNDAATSQTVYGYATSNTKYCYVHVRESEPLYGVSS